LLGVVPVFHGGSLSLLVSTLRRMIEHGKAEEDVVRNMSPILLELVLQRQFGR
jgi:hypothetical protein